MKKMFLDGIVGWDFNARAVRSALSRLNGEAVEVEINSPGGNSWEGFSIYNELARYSGEVTTVINGTAASAASIIALAGDTRKALEGSMYMIHNAAFGVMGYVNKETALQMVDQLSKWDESAEKFYAKLTNIENPQQAMINETFYTADEMLENGIVSEIIETTNKKVKEPKAMLDEIKGAWAKGLSKPAKEPVVSIVDTDTMQMVATAQPDKPAASDDNEDTVKEVLSAVSDMTKAMTTAVEAMSENMKAMTETVTAVHEDVKALKATDPKSNKDPEPADPDKDPEPTVPADPEPEDNEATPDAIAKAVAAALADREKDLADREAAVAKQQQKLDNYFGDEVSQYNPNKWGDF